MCYVVTHEGFRVNITNDPKQDSYYFVKFTYDIFTFKKNFIFYERII